MSIRQGRKTKSKLEITACATVICVFGCTCCIGPEKLSRQEQEARDWIKALGGKIETGHLPWTGRITGHIVDLAGSKVRDEELHHLKKLAPRLDSLDLSETGIDGSGMPKLAEIVDPKHSSISKLSLSHTMVTDEALGRFIEGASVNYLDLSDTRITDEGIKGLIAADIGILDLSNTKVTGVGIRRLKDITFLREVHLRRLPLKDDDIPALIDLTKKEFYLWSLDLRDTKLSKPGVLQLRDTLRSSSIATKIIFGEK